MAVLEIFSPGWLTGGTTTQFVANPWGTADVWIQCGVGSLAVGEFALAGWGIIEFENLEEGAVQRTTFGDVSDLENVDVFDLPPRMFVPNLISVTLASPSFDLNAVGTVTLYQWG